MSLQTKLTVHVRTLTVPVEDDSDVFQVVKVEIPTKERVEYRSLSV